MNKKTIYYFLTALVFGTAAFFSYGYHKETVKIREKAEGEYLEALREEQSKPQPRVKAIPTNNGDAPVSTSDKADSGGNVIVPVTRAKGARK